MAYDDRISELQDRLRSAAPSSDDPAVSALSEGIKRYAEIRSSALDDLVDVIEDATIGTRGLQEKWQSIARRARDEVDRAFGDAAKEVLLAQPLQTFWAATVQFERSFFDKLAAVKTPQFIEDLLTHQGVLAQMIDKLQTIWSGLLSEDKTQEAAQMNTVKELDRLVQDLTNEIEKQNQAVIAETTLQLQAKMQEAADRVKKGLIDKIGERAAEVATAAFKLAIEYLKDKLPIPKEIDTDLEAVKQRIQRYIEMLATFAKAYRDHAEHYRSLMSIEKGGVLTMFKETREQVIEYERKNNLVTAQIMRDEAKRFLSNWADSDCVDDQGDDADEFNAKIFNVIDKNWKVTEEMAKQFESKFSGIFYAPLTSDTLETLTESYMFRLAIDGINNRGVTAQIDKSQKQLEASVEDTVEKVIEPLESMSTDWSDDLKALAKLSEDEFRAYVRDKLKAQVDRALNSLGELRFLIDPPKVVADFTREELDAMLRS
jgi:hypothetical protein